MALLPGSPAIGGGKPGVRRGVTTGAMFLLAVLFVIVPIVELAVIIQVGHVIGFLPTIYEHAGIAPGTAPTVVHSGECRFNGV